MFSVIYHLLASMWHLNSKGLASQLCNWLSSFSKQRREAWAVSKPKHYKNANQAQCEMLRPKYWYLITILSSDTRHRKIQTDNHQIHNYRPIRFWQTIIRSSFLCVSYFIFTVSKSLSLLSFSTKAYLWQPHRNYNWYVYVELIF